MDVTSPIDWSCGILVSSCNMVLNFNLGQNVMVAFKSDWPTFCGNDLLIIFSYIYLTFNRRMKTIILCGSVVEYLHIIVSRVHSIKIISKRKMESDYSCNRSNQATESHPFLSSKPSTKCSSRNTKINQIPFLRILHGSRKWNQLYAFPTWLYAVVKFLKYIRRCDS